ncbi:glycerophosphodiester phosphodiesterase family protein [Gryllotalpicola protaetiae]|uniref:glycerophosphodiester phosphodiesterase family protein n=1 Tax=Gryllotalpicola protaetiae TaxID=2419771 RepID=UPI001FEA2BBD|nr:glycerophosphodiester phosphodiesterase family protein [Gryllotalpicola protaetiae]
MLAHRGLATSAPENTLLAFAAALAAGAPYIETDVHVSADGVAVVSHDPDLKRLAGREARIAQLTGAELAKVDLGHGQSYSTLAEALEAFPDARFNIDVKARAAADAVAGAVLGAGATRRVLITSFDDATRRATLAALGGSHAAATSASQRGVIWALVGARLGLGFLVRAALAGVDAVQVPERQGPLSVVTPRFIDAVHRAGAEVHVWVVNDAAAMRRLIALGVDGIVTDRVDLAVSVVKDLANP